MNEITLTNAEIIEGGMLVAARELLKNRLSVAVRVPLKDFVKYCERRAEKFFAEQKEIVVQFKIADGTRYDALTGEAKTEMDALRNYPGRIQMDLIPLPQEPVEGGFELVLEKIFVKHESVIKELEPAVQAEEKK